MGYLVSIHGISSRVLRTCLVGKVLYLITGPAEGEVQGWLPLFCMDVLLLFVVVVFHVLAAADELLRTLELRLGTYV